MTNIQHVDESELKARAQSLEMILLDVDGVLTNGGIVYDSEDREIKQFNVKDGMGILLAREVGIDVGIITGRASPMVKRRARELGIDQIFQGQDNKLEALDVIQDETGYSTDQLAYMGDDVNDLPVLQEVSIPAAPSDAITEIRQSALILTENPGGRGAVREWVDYLLELRQQKQDAYRSYNQ